MKKHIRNRMRWGAHWLNYRRDVRTGLYVLTLATSWMTYGRNFAAVSIAGRKGLINVDN